jgi:hypothetical protein
MQIKLGVALIALGALVYAGWNGWLRTRSVKPVDEPVTVVAGQQVTESFLLNYDGLYLIEIAAENTAAGKKGLSLLGAEWSVSSSGRETNHGTTDEVHSPPGKNRGVSRVLGEFNGRAGQSCELRVRFTKDAPELLGAKPRLQVAVCGLATENLNAAAVLTFSILFICELFGMILVGVGLVGRRRGV